MSGKTELQKVSEETMRFMRGKYVLDEVGDGNNKLEFREDRETILTIRIHEDRYDFHIDEKYIPVADLETRFLLERLDERTDRARCVISQDQGISGAFMWDIPTIIGL